MKKLVKIGGCFIALLFLALVCGCGGGGGGGDETPAPTPTPTPSPNAQLSGEYFAAYYSETAGTLRANIPTKTITDFSNPDDWAGIPPFIVDVDYSATPYRPFSGSDISNVYLAQDENYLYCKIDLADGNPNQNPSDPTIYYTVRLRQIPTQTSVGDRYINGYYNKTEQKWFTVVRYYDEQLNAQILFGPVEDGWVAVGSSFIAMRAPLDCFTNIPNITLRYIYAGTVYLYSTPPDVWDWADWTDTLDGRFRDISDQSYRKSALGTFTFDGNGNYSYSGTLGSNAEGANKPDPISGTGTYTVNSDGTVSISGMGGWQFGLQKGSGMLVGAAVNDPGNFQGIATIFKKGGSHTLMDRDTSFVTFNRDHRDNYGPFSMAGYAEASVTGDVTTYYTLNSQSGITPNQSSTGTYTRNTDGSGTNTYPYNVYSSNPPGPIHTKAIPIVYDGAIRDDEKFGASVKLDNQNRNRQRISMSITKPTAAQSIASLVGDFFFALYQNEGGKRTSMFGTITFDGAGAYSMTLTGSTSDQGGNLSASESGTYTYDAATGTFLIVGDPPATLVLNDEGDIGLGANMADTSYQNIAVGVKIK